MLLPIYQPDLNSGFDKLSKYISRHWPLGPLGQGKGRNITSYLLGYNTYHEVLKVAGGMDESQIATFAGINIKQLQSVMAGKALYKYQVNPTELLKVLRKAPFCELSVYEVSADLRTYKEEMASNALLDEQLNSFKAGGKLVMLDEMASYSQMNGGNKTPDSVLSLHDNGKIPRYEYAVNEDGLLFSSVRFENLIKELGSLAPIVDGLGLTQEEYIKQYVLPMAWLPVKEAILVSKDDYWHLPEFIEIKKARRAGGDIGYLILHKGVNGFYPVICESIEKVISAVSKIYLGEFIGANSHDQADFDEITFTNSFMPHRDSLEAYFAGTIKVNKSFLYKGQTFFEFKPVWSYSGLAESKLLNHAGLDSNHHYYLNKIDEDVLMDEIVQSHYRLQNQEVDLIDIAGHAFNVNEQALEPVSIDNIVEALFGGMSIDPELIEQPDVWCDYETEDNLDDWFSAIGRHLKRRYPELAQHFTDLQLGRILIEHEDYDYDECIDPEVAAEVSAPKDVEFLAAALTYSPLLQLGMKNQTRCCEVAILLMSYCIEAGGQFDVIEAIEEYKKAYWLLTMSESQNDTINTLMAFSEFTDNHDMTFVTHGKESSYQRQSMSEAMQEISRAGRKHNASKSLL